MKPTVISTGSGESPTSHPAGSTVNPSANNVGAESGTNPNAYANSRQFPQFQSRFGFEPDMDDIFSDAGIRSRLNRMRDPFSFTRKRYGTNPYAEHYSRYFKDDPDFFPNFGSLGRRRTAPLETEGNGIFEHIPAEFRHYIPDGFGFPHRSAPQSPKTAPQQPPQFYEAYVQPASPTTPTTAQPPQQKPKLCDAAIQTEDINQEGGELSQGKNLKQHGLRNTVDLGQKSPPEESRGPRSQSAPPSDAEQNAFQTATSSSVPSSGFAAASAYAHAAAQPSQDTYQPYAQHKAQSSQSTQSTQSTAPPQPPPRQNIPQQQYQQTSQEPPTTPGGHIRTVPIFVEGRSEPVINKTAAQQYQQQPPRQQQQQVPRQPQQQTPRQPQQKPGHPTPLDTSQQIPQDSGNQTTPQTPHTAASITKIQDIQRDVLALMSKVEHFKGLRGDKEYMYLDEMLTRNLLKLDTIDASGKESIRLARKEAIKCIQASINVLEAKAEENKQAKTAQQAVMETDVQTEQEKTNDEGNNETDEQQPVEKVAIPLPPPGGLQNTVEGEKTSTEEEEQKVEEPSKEEIKEESAEKNPEQKLEKTEISIQIAPVEPGDTSKEPIPLPPIPTETTAEITNEPVSDETKNEDTNKLETTPDIVKPVENVQNVEVAPESKSESTTPAENTKSTGAVKKKIIKKKKVPLDKKEKSSDSPTPPKLEEKITPETAKSSENQEQPAKEQTQT